jgi:DNA-binding transcriptional LysR family regulator
LDLHYLKIFYEVAKEQSFTKASQKLFINQSAVSIQVKKFEEILRIKLFDRSTKQIKLTYYGEALYKMAEDIFDKVKRTEHEMSRMIEVEKIKISIGASPVIGEPLLAKLMKGFSVKHKEIDFEIFISSKDYLLRQLKEGEIDVIIIDFEQIKDSNLEVFIVDTVPYVFVGAKKYSSMKEIAKEPLISRKNINNNNKAMIYLENKNRVQFEKIIHVEGNIELIKNMTKEGLGNAILPYYSVKKEIENGHLIMLEKIDEVEDGYQIVITKDKRNLLQVIKFISYVQNHKI